ncbi:uncharacterized protein LTR77_003107 [Saxophila tyrrhenica]|uniref:Uncharacterized protein n=1 Tax=Saxophila tyrrhenica TaxID=1690608 RepID=A0AAV9PK25_9PEZI|nr:hypothetical protein LTR77_003107 [Saxophila tyrrhenica]
MARYDWSSGQVYHELIVRQEMRAPLPWEHWCQGAKLSKHRSSYGADSLLNSALRKAVCNIRHVDPDTLRALPPSIVEIIWKAVKREESFGVWKQFVEAGFGSESTPHFARIGRLDKPLVDHFITMRSPGFGWLVDLELSVLDFSHQDFKSLSVLHNLENLTVFRESPTAGSGISSVSNPFNDGSLAALSSRAAAEGTLTRFRRLIIYDAKGVTEKSFGILCSFPALDFYCVVGTGVKPRRNAVAGAHGWMRTAETSRFSRYIQEYNLRFQYDNHGHASLRDIIKGFVQKQRSEEHCNSAVLTCAIRPGQSENPCLVQELSQIKVFERDWNFHEAASRVSDTKRKAPAAELDPKNDSLAKRRKIKDGKRIGFDQMLDGL